MKLIASVIAIELLTPIIVGVLGASLMGLGKGLQISGLFIENQGKALTKASDNKSNTIKFNLYKRLNP